MIDGRMQQSRSELLAASALVAGIVLAALLAIVASRISTELFVAAGCMLVGLVAIAGLRWPRAVLVGVVLSPILDRYIAPGLLAPSADKIAHFLSEGLLSVVGLALLLQAVRRGTLRSAFTHPAFAFTLAFVALAAVSAVVNRVPIGQAIAGVAFTADAIALFFLARVVGFGTRQAIAAIGVVMGVVLAAAVVTIGQALLTPDLFGLASLQGRFGELYRLAAFFGDPNTLAAFLSAAIPFAIFGAAELPIPRSRRLALAAAFLLVLALWLSFSRGGWLGAIGGFGIAALILDRRALRIGLLAMVIGLGIALVMPRNLACTSCAGNLDLFGSTFGRIDTVGAGQDLRTLFIKNAVPIALDHPLLGVGPGRYGGAAAHDLGTPIYKQYGTDKLFTNPTQRTVDDFWLHLAVESGILGLLAFLAIIGSALRPIMHAARSAIGGRRVVLAGLAAAVIGLSLNGVTTMLLEANSAAFLFWFLLGIGSQLVKADDPASPVGEVAVA